MTDASQKRADEFKRKHCQGHDSITLGPVIDRDLSSLVAAAVAEALRDFEEWCQIRARKIIGMNESAVGQQRAYDAAADECARRRKEGGAS